MRSSLIVGVALLLTLATPSIVQARKSGETCGNLGPGINACKCGEIVVKAAKVQKPLLYASPEAINEAAVAREAVGRLSVESFPKYKSYASGGTFSGSSSGSSFSSSSSSSSVGVLGGLIGGSKAYSLFSPDKVTSSCGCGKTSESLQIRDILSSNVEGKVVPSFPPIGDLCYPGSSPRSDKFQVTTKVTPAYPGKIKCVPPIPYEVCVQILNGQIDEAGLRKLGLATGGNLGKYISNDVSGAATQGGFYGSLGGYGGYAGVGSSASSTAGSSAYGGFGGYGGYGGYGSYTGGAGTIGQSSSRTSVVTSSNGGSAASYRSSCESNDFDDESEFSEDYSYPRLPADPVSVTLAYKNLFPHTVYYNNRRTFVPEDKLAFGHRTVPTESTPGKKVADVPEEKLQTLDKPVVELKPVSPVPVTVGVYDEHEEAKLAELEAIERERINQEQIVQRQQENLITYGDLGYAPINRVPTGRSFAAGPTSVFNAENDVEADCGPVGPPDPDYVPGSIVIDRELVENEGEVEADVPRNSQGSEVYVRHYAGDETSDEEDDSDDSTSGIFARLRSVARKYGPRCGAPL
ncbi:uncharacterized protein [Temnothorax longispinosus]